MSDLPAVTTADTEYCFECGRLWSAEGPCEGCSAALAAHEGGIYAYPVVELLMGHPTTSRGELGICKVCGIGFVRGDQIRKVLLADVSRGFAHERCWRRRDPETDEGCKHGLVPATSCQWCSGKVRIVHPRSKVFRSGRPGRCIVCEEHFGAGSLIARVSTSVGTGWCHARHLGE